MAGMGADALIMAETNADLKKIVGSAAYVMAALQALNQPPFSVRVTVGDHEPVERRAGLAMVANVGAIQGQIQIAPDAQPDDGRLDLVVASPEKPTDWGAITTRILARANDAPGVERAQAKVVTFDVDEPVPYQIDGDPMGECSRLEASSLARVLEVMTPGRRP
jgi:diacylglycerol kinase (ATP)